MKAQQGQSVKQSSKKYYQVRARTLVGVSENKETITLRIAGDSIPNQRRFIPVGVGDEIRRDAGNMWVKLRNMKGEVQIKPAWRYTKHLQINGKKVRLLVKEIETQEELSAYRILTKFHYRGTGGVGRRIPLIAELNIWNLPKIVGFVEISSSLIVNVARKSVLNKPYYDSDRGIQWDSWDMDTAKKYTNTIVRISRCVVYPELRGLGLAAELTKAAVRYARERWHVGGLRPCFIEVVAEMLRYWPFVEKAGFVKVGETEGNEKRAPKAMEYLLTRKEEGRDYPKGGGGIMTMHRMHANKLDAIRKKRKFSIDRIVGYLKKPSEKLSVENWILLHDLFRRKKPTYMLGLTNSACAHLKNEVLPNPMKEKATKNKKSGVLVSIDKMWIKARVKPKNSARCREIQEAFGIVSNEFKFTLIHDFSRNISAGEVILVTGASGVGKSIFLDAIWHLTHNAKKKPSMPIGITIGGKVQGKVKVVRLQNPPKNKAPIELLSANSLDESMQFLARAGLAEAQLFVRPAFALSAGQSYRLSIAIALSKKPAILLIDGFCEPLDEYTTAAVCRKIRKIANTEGLSVIVATADARKVLPELLPDQNLLLLPNGEYNWVNQTAIKKIS